MPAARFCQLRSINSFDELCNQIDDALMLAAIKELYNVRVLKGCGNVNLSHEATKSLIADGHLRQQSFDCYGASSLLISRQHHAAHPAFSKNLHHIVAGNGLRLLLQLIATVFAEIDHLLVRRRGFGLAGPPATLAVDCDD